MFEPSIVILALVQGLTEFLPVSSSGHLVLVHQWLGQGPHDRVMDVAVHIGTLLAALVVFRTEIMEVVKTGPSPVGLIRNPFVMALGASVPVMIAGLVFYQSSPDFLSWAETVAWANLIFAVPLWAADKWGGQHYHLYNFGWRRAMIIGLAQALALIPGTSRSGITITAGRALGLERLAAVRFSLLLSIFAICGAGLVTGFDSFYGAEAEILLPFFTAVFLAFLTGLIGIAVLLRLAAGIGMGPFVIYRLVLGAGLLAYLYF